jgi:hypothetical protein
LTENVWAKAEAARKRGASLVKNISLSDEEEKIWYPR